MAVLASVVILVISLMTAAFYCNVKNASPIDPVALPLAPFPKLAGVYARNTLLQNAEQLGTGRVLQPEDFAVDPTGNFLYAATSDGWIKKLRLSDGDVEDWKYVGGRPLGVAVGNDGEVFVCESSRGLLKVTEEGIEILATEVEDGTKLLFVDGVVVASNGLVYFTDASTKFPLEVHLLDTLEGRPNGRILVYNSETKTTTVLLQNLYFPNGIALSKDESFLVFAESSASRIRKYFLKGDNEGQLQTLNENLPGFPDNVHYNVRKDILYVGIVGQRNGVLNLLWKLPWVKSLLAVYPSLCDNLDETKQMAGLLAMDENGKTLKWYQDPSGKTAGYVRGAVEVDGYLCFGGLRDTFVGRIKV